MVEGRVHAARGSEGAVTATLAAVLIPATDRLVAFSFGPARTLREALPGIVEKQMRGGVAPPEAIEAQLAEIRENMAEIRANPTPEKSMGSESTTYKWWTSALDLRPVLALKQLEIPVLLLHGRLDQASDVAAAREAADILSASGRDNVKYFEYETLAHTCRNPDGNNRLRQVVGDMRAWLAESGTGSASR